MEMKCKKKFVVVVFRPRYKKIVQYKSLSNKFPNCIHDR